MPKIDIVNAKNIIESNPEKAFFKLKNTGGPKGDTGAQGPQGPKGDQGEPGAPGASASVTVGSTTTLSPGADATVTNSGDTRNAILNFGIPTGAQGPQGIQGPKGDTGPMGQTGAKGDTGAAATVQVGNTNTGAPGTNAQVTNAGNEHFAVFNFTIPRGDKGETGSTGPQGPKGDTGEQGPQGIQGPKGDTGSVKSDVVAELPETGEEDTFYLVNREATEQTATGKTINFTNSDNAGDITDFKLDGNTVQNGTPTPDAPVAVQTVTGENVVKICGKNLFDAETETSVFIDSSGNIIPGSTWSCSDYIKVSPNTTYTWHGEQTGSLRGQLIWAGYDSYQAFISGQYAQVNNTAGISFTTGASTEYVRVGYRNDRLEKMQLELGSTATAYQAYQEQSYEVNLGKNLLEFASTYTHLGITTTLNNDGTITVSNTPTNNYANVIRMKTIDLPAGTYTLSRFNTDRNFTIRLYWADGTYNNYSLTSSSNTFTTTKQAVKFYMWIYGLTPGTAMNETMALQLEKGSATSFAAYFEPIELCKIGDYQDSIYKSDNKWYMHKETNKVTVDGSAGGFNSTNNWYFYSILNQSLPSPVNNGEVTSNYFAGSTRAYMQNNKTVDGLAAISTTTDIIMRNTAHTTEEAYKTWLSSTKPAFYYPLATPTDTEITNQALITQLDNVASAPLYTGVNNITTITPNEQGTLEIKYVTYDKYNQNKVYIWNDTLQQWQIIVQ